MRDDSLLNSQYCSLLGISFALPPSDPPHNQCVVGRPFQNMWLHEANFFHIAEKNT